MDAEDASGLTAFNVAIEKEAEPLRTILEKAGASMEPAERMEVYACASDSAPRCASPRPVCHRERQRPTLLSAPAVPHVPLPLIARSKPYSLCPIDVPQVARKARAKLKMQERRSAIQIQAIIRTRKERQKVGRAHTLGKECHTLALTYAHAQHAHTCRRVHHSFITLTITCD